MTSRRRNSLSTSAASATRTLAGGVATAAPGAGSLARKSAWAWAATGAASRRRIARLYAETIGYDPFEDDPTLTAQEALSILRERRAEALGATTNETDI